MIITRFIRPRALKPMKRYEGPKKVALRGIFIGHLVATERFVASFDPGPGYAGRIDMGGEFVNNTGRILKSYSIRFVPLNAKGEIVSCTIRNMTERGVVFPWYLRSGHAQPFEATNIWYNEEITQVKLTRVMVEYLSGEREILTPSQVACFDWQDKPPRLIDVHKRH